MDVARRILWEKKWVEIIRGESPNCHAHKCPLVCALVSLLDWQTRREALFGRCAWTHEVSPTPPHHKTSLSLRHVTLVELAQHPYSHPHPTPSSFIIMSTKTHYVLQCSQYLKIHLHKQSQNLEPSFLHFI